jgi:hypothetical protein
MKEVLAMLVFEQYSTLISSDQIDQIVKLLDPVYQSLDVTIAFYDDANESLKKNVELGLSKESLSDIYLIGSIAGMHLGSLNRIHSYTFVRRKVIANYEILKIHILFDFLHELRHAYQQRQFRKILSFEQLLCNRGKIPYENLWIEQDANHFASLFIQKNAINIAKILQIQTNMNWGYPLPIVKKKPKTWNLALKLLTA